ncbi:ATP-binding protein [Methanothrix sp.]|jgi:DNA replication protein DnaC|uniref:ATP-binding protein n=1 Tax=Methanothrix sp. TaxID=90426 RepID=UPI0032AEE9A3
MEFADEEIAGWRKRLRFLKKGGNVILIGNSGTGKTHMAIAVEIRACEGNYRVEKN